MMRTEQSDAFVKEWARKDKSLKRGAFTAEKTFKADPVAFTKLLCPTTELDWLPGWSCELLHSDSGYTEYGVVFRTSFFGTEEVWMCTRFEPCKIVEYTRMSPNRIGKMEINIVDHHDGTLTGRWAVTFSALNEAGNQDVEELKGIQKHFYAVLDQLEHYVNTGEMAA